MLEFSRPALPQIDLTDSLGTVTTLASQLQATITAALSHPFLALCVVLVSIGLLQLIADLIKRLLKATLTFVLTLPLNLSQWVWKRATAPTTDAQNEKIEQLLTKLDTLRQEQDDVVAELKALLSSRDNKQGTAPFQKSLTEATEKDDLATTPAKPEE